MIKTPVPEKEITPEINQLIKKLSSEEYEKVKKYINELLEENYISWENAMGDDL